MNRDDGLEQALRTAIPPSDGEANPEQAVERLALAAEEHGLLDVAYAPVESPVGPMLAAVTERGVVRVSWHFSREEEVLAELARRVSPRILRAPARVDGVRRQLDDYFQGRRETFDLPLDWSLARGFSRRVLDATSRVPFGEVTTYRSVATAAGSAGAVRAAGNALGANPIAIVVPCHRVVRTGGGLGGYGGGLDRKEFLLRLEGFLES